VENASKKISKSLSAKGKSHFSLGFFWVWAVFKNYQKFAETKFTLIRWDFRTRGKAFFKILAKSAKKGPFLAKSASAKGKSHFSLGFFLSWAILKNYRKFSETKLTLIRWEKAVGNFSKNLQVSKKTLFFGQVS
jgi:hypothetical protein